MGKQARDEVREEECKDAFKMSGHHTHQER